MGRPCFSPEPGQPNPSFKPPEWKKLKLICRVSSTLAPLPAQQAGRKPPSKRQQPRPMSPSAGSQQSRESPGSNRGPSGDCDQVSPPMVNCGPPPLGWGILSALFPSSPLICGHSPGSSGVGAGAQPQVLGSLAASAALFSWGLSSAYCHFSLLRRLFGDPVLLPGCLSPCQQGSRCARC